MELCEQCGAMLLDFEIENYHGLCADCYQEQEDNSEGDTTDE